MLDAYYTWLKIRITGDELLSQRGVDVDWYLRQYYTARGAEDGGLVIKTPICYIEIMPITWRTLPMNIQRAVLTFRVHILTDTIYADERSFVLDDKAPDTNSYHLEIRQRIYTLLMNQRVYLSMLPANIAGGYMVNDQDAVVMESIVRTSSPVTSEQLNDLILSIEEFQCVVTDYTASPLYQKVEDVALEVNCEKLSPA